jgi:hypothetical protein
VTDVFTVPSHAVDVWWPQLRPHLERFERETQRVDAETIRKQAKNCERQIWGVMDGMHVVGVAVTEVYVTPRWPVCWVWYAVGNGGTDAMAKIYDEIEKWARSIGCGSIGICGRKGWIRVLPGFKQTAIVLEKDLRC